MVVKYNVYYMVPDEDHRIQYLKSLSITRAIHPREDRFNLFIAGIHAYEVGREIFIYRRNDEINENKLIFRGIITKKNFTVSSTEGKITNLSGRGLWYTLEMKLYADPKAQAPGYPNNPYIGIMNEGTLFKFDEIFTRIMEYHKGSKSSAYVPVIQQGTCDFTGVEVNDYCFIQYATVAEALEKLVSSSMFQELAEFQLDFWSSSTPVLNIKKFDPVNNMWGVGEDKRTTFRIVESQNAKVINAGFDYEAMGNSLVVTGAKYHGADIIAVERCNDDSIIRYGFKQITKSVGICVSREDIDRYVFNVLPLISTPIPSIDIEFTKDAFLKTKMINPGDVINLYSESLSTVFDSPSIDARVRTLEIRYSPEEGEKISCTLTYPLQRSYQSLAGFAKPTIETLIASFKRETRDALYTTNGVVYELLPFSLDFELSDTTVKDVFIYPFDISALISKSDSSVSASILISGIRINVNGQTNNTRNIHVTLARPDGGIILDKDIELGSSYNLTETLRTIVNSNYVPLTEFRGKYYILFKNTVSNSWGKYNALIEISYLRDTSKSYGVRGGIPTIIRGGWFPI